MSTSAEHNGAARVDDSPSAGARDVRPSGTHAAHDTSTVVRQDTVTTPVQVNVPEQQTRADQVRWGPVWAGLTIALPTFILLELVFLALGWLDISEGGNQAGWATGLIGLFSFFLGGLTAGATAMWRGVNTGLLHGILVWALGVVAFLALTLFGGGALLGTFGNIATNVLDVGQVASNVDVPQLSAQEATDAAQSAASWAVLGLGLTILASALGGVIGAKMWPRKHKAHTSAN